MHIKEYVYILGIYVYIHICLPKVRRLCNFLKIYKGVWTLFVLKLTHLSQQLHLQHSLPSVHFCPSCPLSSERRGGLGITVGRGRQALLPP